MSTFACAHRVAVALGADGAPVAAQDLPGDHAKRMMAIACGPVGDGGKHPFLAGVANSDQKGVARRTKVADRARLAARLGGIPQPTLVLLGDADRFSAPSPSRVRASASSSPVATTAPS